MDRLKLASYNVHAWVGADGRRDPARSVAVLDSLGADIIALQEVRALAAERVPVSLAELCESAGYVLHEGTTLHDRDAPYGNALLTRTPVVATARLDLSLPGREARGALAVDVEAGDRIVRCVATHLGLRRGERARQVERLLAWLAAEEANDAPDALVLLGDFNEWRPGGEALRRLGARFGRAPAPRSFPARWPLVRLDRIFASPRSALRRCEARRDRRIVAASDHLPVVAELDLTNLPARRVRSRCGAGARLPARSAPRRASRMRSFGSRSLIVQRDLDETDMLAAWLRRHGHHVVRAHRAGAALALARATRPDWIFLDLELPDMSGHELAERLRAADDRRVSVPARLVALAGAVPATAVSAPFDFALAKPLHGQALEALLAEDAGASRPLSSSC